MRLTTLIWNFRRAFDRGDFYLNLIVTSKQFLNFFHYSKPYLEIEKKKH